MWSRQKRYPAFDETLIRWAFRQRECNTHDRLAQKRDKVPWRRGLLALLVEWQP